MKRKATLEITIDKDENEILTESELEEFLDDLWNLIHESNNSHFGYNLEIKIKTK